MREIVHLDCTNRVPSYQALKELIPLSEGARCFIEKTRKSCQQILQGQDARKVVVVGPCSIHNIEEALQYAQLLKELSYRVADSCLLIMRVYVEKARTALGWKGIIYDPQITGQGNLLEGIVLARRLLVELAEQGIACATEFVDPLIAPYIEDLISWGFIGARTSASQSHRQFASALSMPIGFKNTIDGNIQTAIYAVKSAHGSHTFLFPQEDHGLYAVRSCGNPFTHIVLRGSMQQPNYTLSYLNKAIHLLKQENLTPKIMIDCSHGNAQGYFDRQSDVFYYILEAMQQHGALFGIMLESYLKPGKQEAAYPLEYGISITDPCLDWEATEKLLLDAHATLSIMQEVY